MREAETAQKTPVNVNAPDLPNESPKAIWMSNVASPLCKYAHKSSTQATGTYAVHTHPFYEMVYIVTGNVEFMVDDHPFRVGDHTMLTFPPGIRHGVLVDTDRPYERYTLHFDPSCLSVERRPLLQETIPRQLFSAEQWRSESRIWRDMEHSGALQCLEAMETLRLATEDTVALLLPVYLEALLATLYAVQRSRGRNARREFRATTTQQELVLWVERHYTESITLEALADRFYLSKGYVNTLFRQATGDTVKAYVLKRRMSYVQMLLAAGLPTAQAANRAGFEDYTTFYRAYMRTFGHAPSDAKRAAARNELLAEALGAKSPVTYFSQGEIVYPEQGTAIEDPSMLNAVRIPPGPEPGE